MTLPRAIPGVLQDFQTQRPALASPRRILEWRRDFLPEHISFVNQYPSALDVVAERRSVDAVPAADGHHCHIFSYSACSARHTVWSGAEDPGLNPVAGRPTRRLKRRAHPDGHRCDVPQFAGVLSVQGPNAPHNGGQSGAAPHRLVDEKAGEDMA